MNRLAVGRSARAQQAQKVNNRINWLMHLNKTDTNTQTTSMSGDPFRNPGQTMNRIQHPDRKVGKGRKQDA